MLQPKLGKMLVFDSADFEKKNIRRIPIHPKNVSKIVILYIYFYIYRIGIILNLPYINNFLFIFSIK